MAIYSRGKKVKSIYVKGKLVSNVFSRGKSVYENYPRLLGYMYFYVLNSDGSEFGNIRFKKYLDFDKELNTEVIRYERDYFEGIGNLTEEHNLVLEFPEDCLILVNSLRMSTYNKKASLSGQEFAGVLGFITTNKQWPDELATAYTYIQPIYGLQLGTAVGFLTITNGYCIASNNRDSRLNLSMQGSYNLSSIGVTSDGTYPVYAVATSTGIENQITIISCNTMTIQASSLFRHIGWLTKSGNNTSVVSLGTPISGSQFSKSATSPNIVVSGGLGTDTTGCQVPVDSSTTSCQTYINEAKKANDILAYTESYSYELGDKVSTYGHSFNTQNYPNTWILGPCEYKMTTTWTNVYKASQGNPYRISMGLYVLNTASSPVAVKREEKDWETDYTRSSVPSSKTITGTLAEFEGISYVYTTANTENSVQGSAFSTDYYKASINLYRIEYYTQTAKLYRKITRDKDSSKVTYESVFLKTSEATPQSTPYVSYVLIGTVTAQAKTGTLSIS